MKIKENKSANPLVSLIIPIFNAENFLVKGYSYILDQDYPNLEIIFIDNNSTDKSVELIEEFKNKDERILLIYETKQGAGAARNKGIKESSGEIISFFDIDDYIVKNKISKHVTILNKNPEVALVFGKVSKLYPNNYSYLIPDNMKPGIHMPYTLGIKMLFYFGCIVGPPFITCRKDATLAVGGFEESLLRGEDAAFMIKMALNNPVYYDDMLTGTYNRRSESTVSLDNLNFSGNPYYLQFSQFYLPYINDFAKKNNDLRLIKRLNFTILVNLNLHIHLISNNLLKRIITIAKEMKYLRKHLFPNKYLVIAYFNSIIPLRLSNFLIKIYFVIFIKKLTKYDIYHEIFLNK